MLHTDTCCASGDAIRSRYRFPFGFYSFLRSARVPRPGAGWAYCIAPFRTHRSFALHGAHLCSRHSKRMASRWPDLPHALPRGVGHCASLWPCSWQRSHTSLLYAALLHMRFVSTRAAYADRFVWALARRIASCTACAARSVWARASLLAMPRLRAQRIGFCSARRVCLFGAIRIRSERKPSVV